MTAKEWRKESDASYGSLWKVRQIQIIDDLAAAEKALDTEALRGANVAMREADKWRLAYEAANSRIEAMKPYMMHKEDCGVYAYSPPRPCTCGRDALVGGGK